MLLLVPVPEIDTCRLASWKLTLLTSTYALDPSSFEFTTCLFPTSRQYHTIPGTSTVIPIMSLDADLAKLSLTGAKKAPDPVSDAMKNGRMPTLGEVKRSIKVCTSYSWVRML